MKKFCACLVLLFIASFVAAAADDPDIIMQATIDAEEDGASFRAFGVGLGAFILSFLGTPLAGIVFTLAAYSWIEAEVPAARIEAIQEGYDDPDLVSLYESQYRQTLTSIKRRRSGGAALVGTGLSVAVSVGLLVYVLNALVL